MRARSAAILIVVSAFLLSSSALAQWVQVAHLSADWTTGMVRCGDEIYVSTDNAGIFVARGDSVTSFTAINAGLSGLSSWVIGAAGSTVMGYSSAYNFNTQRTEKRKYLRNQASILPWQEISLPYFDVTDKQPISFFAHGGAVLIGTNTHGVVRTDYNFGTWAWADSGSSHYDQPTSFAAIGDTLFMATNDSGVFRSLDTGTTWVRMANAYPYRNPSITQLTAVGSVLLGQMLVDGLVRSEDYGDSWQLVNAPPLDINPNIWGFAVSDSLVFMAVFNGGVFASADKGNTWVNWSDGLISPNSHGLVVRAGYVYSATYSNYIFRRPVAEFSVTDVLESDRPVPTENVLLAQNYPNPFNPLTTISFELPRKSAYVVTIFNATGRAISRFAGTAGPGIVKQTWDASGNASGVYFYKLTAGSFSQTKKMVLLK